MKLWMNHRLLNVVSVLFLISLIMPVMPAVSAQGEFTLETSEQSAPDPAEQPAGPETAEETVVPTDPPSVIPTEAPTEAPVTPTETVPPVDTSENAPRVAPAMSRIEELAPAGILTVHVTDQSNGAPIVGASIVVRDGASEVASGMTGADGSFTTESLPNSSDYDYNIDVSADGYFDGRGSAWVNGDTDSLVSLKPRLAGTLTVHVMDQSNGAPTAGISILVRDSENEVEVASGMTGADGSFTTESLPSSDYTIDVSADGYFPKRHYASVNGDTDAVVWLQPRIAGTLTVYVTDQSNGAPIAGASILIRDSENEVEVTSGMTGADGSFTTESLPSSDYFIKVSADGYADGLKSVLVNGETHSDVSLEPRPDGRLFVRVSERIFGTPVGGASIVIRDADYENVVASGITLPDGSFTTESLPGGIHYRINVSMDGYLGPDGATSVLVSGDTVSYVSLEPRITGNLTVHVSDEISGDPIAGASILINSAGGIGASGMTGADGSFTTESLPGNYYSIYVSADGYWDGRGSVLVSGDTESLVSLEPRAPGTVSVRVRDDLTAAPISGASVVIRDVEKGNDATSGTTGADGTFSSEPLPGGMYNIYISADGYLDRDLRGSFRVSGDRTSEDFYLSPSIAGIVTVSIYVEDIGDPIAGASVVIRDIESGADLVSGITGTDGKFITTQHVPGGIYRLDGSADGYADRTGTLYVSQDSSMSLSLKPSIDGTATVHVIDDIDNERTPVVGASVIIRDLLSDVVVASGITGIDGRFTTETLTGNNYRIDISADGYLDYSRSPALVSGDTDFYAALQRDTDATVTPTGTATVTPTGTATETPTVTETQTSTATIQPTGTVTETPTVTETQTSTATIQPTGTATETQAVTATETPTGTVTEPESPAQGTKVDTLPITGVGGQPAGNTASSWTWLVLIAVGFVGLGGYGALRKKGEHRRS